MVNEPTLLQEIFLRLSELVPSQNIFVATTADNKTRYRQLLNRLPKENFLIEPAQKGPATGYAIAAETILRIEPEATIFSVSSDKVISEPDKFMSAAEMAFDFVDRYPESIMLVGSEPTRVDVGKGYIKVDALLHETPRVHSVEKFVEKPSANIAAHYVESGEYYWSLGHYCFKASTLLMAYEESNPKITEAVAQFVSSKKRVDFAAIPKQPHEIELINTKKFPLGVVLFDDDLRYPLVHPDMKASPSVTKLEALALSETTRMKLAAWRLMRIAGQIGGEKTRLIIRRVSPRRLAKMVYVRSRKLGSSVLPLFTKTTPKKVAILQLREAIDDLGYTVVDFDGTRPWGAFFRLADDQIERFMKEFFPGLTLEAARLGHDDVVLSPKLLLVSPGQRLSWQMHHRRAEIWRFLSAGSYHKSNSDKQGSSKSAPVGRVVQFKRGERHRLCAATEDAYTLVAEIWQHTDPLHPSDESDIVRISDDYGRQIRAT